jgi:hypothetical protein
VQHDRESISVGAGLARPRLSRGVLGDQRVADLLLDTHDLATVALERERVLPGSEPFPFMQKPSEEILEGFHWERVPPARGGCGLR